MDKEHALVSKLEDHKRICFKEVTTKLEAFEKETKEEKEIACKKLIIYN